MAFFYILPKASRPGPTLGELNLRLQEKFLDLFEQFQKRVHCYLSMVYVRNFLTQLFLEYI